MGPVVTLERSSEEKGELRVMSKKGRESCFRFFLGRGKMSLPMKCCTEADGMLQGTGMMTFKQGGNYEASRIRTITSRISEGAYCREGRVESYRCLSMSHFCRDVHPIPLSWSLGLGHHRLTSTDGN